MPQDRLHRLFVHSQGVQVRAQASAKSMPPPPQWKRLISLVLMRNLGCVIILWPFAISAAIQYRKNLPIQCVVRVERRAYARSEYRSLGPGSSPCGRLRLAQAKAAMAQRHDWPASCTLAHSSLQHSASPATPHCHSLPKASLEAHYAASQQKRLLQPLFGLVRGEPQA